MEQKRCSRCGSVKKIKDFYSRALSPDGLQPWCKKCVHEHNHKRHSEHRSEEAKYSRNYRRNHSAVCNESTRRYRNRKAVAGGSCSARDVEQCLAFFDYRCAYSGVPLGNDYQFDHVVPVSRGGTSDSKNLVPCLPTINLSKASKSFEEWYRAQDFYSPERHERIKKWLSEK